MTYAWQLNKSCTVPLFHGQAVMLNPEWSGFQYLRREFGHLFPCMVREIHGDIIVAGKTRFARQVLAPWRRNAVL